MIIRKKIVYIILITFILVLVLYQFINTKRDITDVHRVFKGTMPLSRRIHQSWKTKDLSTDMSSLTDTWKSKNPHYEYHFYNDEDCDKFVREFYPEYYASLYQRFPYSVMRSDFFRYLVVYHYGGVWSDVDTKCLKPIDTWFQEYPDAKAVIAVELDASDVYIDWFSVKIQFCQWTFAAGPKHPLLRNVLELISGRFNGSSEFPSVLSTTGPAIWTEAILDYFRAAGIRNSRFFRFLQKPILVGDVIVLPTTSFAPHNTGMGGKGNDHPYSYVEHLFLGSWKG